MGLVVGFSFILCPFSLSLLILLLSHAVPLVMAQPRACTQDDFDFAFTSCDDKGSRWKVAVPKHQKTECTGNVPFPEKGLNCSFTCSAGKYLDLSTQECRHCAAGSYSLGGGERFEDFAHFPSGFIAENVADGGDLLSGATATKPSEEKTCKIGTGWTVRDGLIKYVPTPCFSKLSYSVNLVRPGTLDYIYRMPTNSRGLMFNVVVKNEQCQSYRDRLKSMLDDFDAGGHKQSSGGGGDWQRGQLALKTGVNVISFTVANNRENNDGPTDAILIARIDITGIAFTKSCALCPAGTFSSDGAEDCTYCEPGQFSQRGAKVCSPCPNDQYSGPRSTKCLDRPKCTATDYFGVQAPCVGGLTKTTYQSVQPMICRDDLPGAVKKPADETNTKCPPCNPGMETNNKGVCEFCAKNHYSDGTDCKKCAVNTVPNYGYQYQWWNQLPKNMGTSCDLIAEENIRKCDIGEAWLPAGDFIHTAATHRHGVALELSIDVPGFSNPLMAADVQPSAQNPVGHITFTFQTSCAASDCAFYFVQDTLDHRGQFLLIADFNGTLSRRAYRHPITRSGAVRFVWAFIRSRVGGESNEDNVRDKAIIYSINVTNVVPSAGGASTCLPCPSSNDKGCIPCSPGHYMQENTRACTKCPSGTMLNTTGDRIGVKSCIKCGSHLSSKDGVACATDGHLTFATGKNRTRKFDLSALGKGPFQVSGVKVYGRGTSYYHLYNVSMFKPTAVCKDTFNYRTSTRKKKLASLMGTVEGSVCRVTALPVRDENTTDVISVSPSVLATTLVGISLEPKFGEISLTKQELDYDTDDVSNRPVDVHFYYESVTTTSDGHGQSRSCKRGNAVVITARCEPNAPKDKVQARLPRACPDGTCDGCVYRLLVLSPHACPICSDKDYTEIKGECVNGYQTIHYIPAKHCVLSGKQSRERTGACTMFGIQVQILIGAAAAMAVLLVALIIMVCRKNQKLEYKYSKLIEAKVGADGVEQELPGAESCGIEGDDEVSDEDGDRVIIASGRRRFLGGRFEKGSKKNNRRGYADIEDDDRRAFVPLEEQQRLDD